MPRKNLQSPIITLLTDYGTRDYYAAALHGVILSIATDVRIVDVTHEIEPQNVQHGAFVLRQIWPWFPPGTIHVAVVDPGVGTDRRIILARYAGSFVIAPDNGLVTFVHRDMRAETAHVVENRRYFAAELSMTFHGRDIMAPAAAHLATGVPPRDFGRTTDRLTMLAVPHVAEETREGFRAEVLYVDRFGTLVTNVRREQLEAATGTIGAWEVVVAGQSIGPVRGTFSEVPTGQPLALIGGSGLLDVAINQGSAAVHFGRHPTITIRRVGNVEVIPPVIRT